MKLNQIISTLIFLLLICTVTSCSKGSKEINYNVDECDYCTMQITDSRFAAMIIAENEKVYKFDSIECLIGFAMVKNFIGDESQKFLITDFAATETFINAADAFFVRSDNFKSPMGLNVMAFESEISRQKFVAENGGQLLNWSDVIVLVKKQNP